MSSPRINGLAGATTHPQAKTAYGTCKDGKTALDKASRCEQSTGSSERSHSPEASLGSSAAQEEKQLSTSESVGRRRPHKRERDVTSHEWKMVHSAKKVLYEYMKGIKEFDVARELLTEGCNNRDWEKVVKFVYAFRRVDATIRLNVDCLPHKANVDWINTTILLSPKPTDEFCVVRSVGDTTADENESEEDLSTEISLISDVLESNSSVPNPSRACESIHCENDDNDTSGTWTDVPDGADTPDWQSASLAVKYNRSWIEYLMLPFGQPDFRAHRALTGSEDIVKWWDFRPRNGFTLEHLQVNRWDDVVYDEEVFDWLVVKYSGVRILATTEGLSWIRPAMDEFHPRIPHRIIRSTVRYAYQYLTTQSYYDRQAGMGLRNVIPGMPSN